MFETRDPSHDFDFFPGRWRVWNERLVRPFANCSQWETFEAIQDANEITHRAFDQSTGLWCLARGGVSLIGGFIDGLGIFEGRCLFEGRSISVRYLWSEVKRDAVKWAQYFSADDGLTWEKNWVMYLTRFGA